MRVENFAPSESIFTKINLNTENKTESNEKVSFSSMLKDSLDKVNDKQIESEKTTEDFIKGEDVEIHDVVLKAEEAKLALELAVQIRNKFVEAYQEINRMQL